MAENETIELMKRMRAEIAEATEGIRAKYAPLVKQVAGQMLPDPVGDAMFVAEKVGDVKDRYDEYMADKEAEYERRKASGERFLDDPWTEESWRKHIGAPPMDDFAPAEIEREPMRMDGMGAGPKPNSIREDVLRNLMATEEPEEEL